MSPQEQQAAVQACIRSDVGVEALFVAITTLKQSPEYVAAATGAHLMPQRAVSDQAASTGTPAGPLLLPDDEASFVTACVCINASITPLSTLELQSSLVLQLLCSSLTSLLQTLLQSQCN